MVNFTDEEWNIVTAKMDAQAGQDEISFHNMTQDFLDLMYPRDIAARLARDLGKKIAASVDDPEDDQLRVRRTGFYAPGAPIMRHGKCISYTRIP